MNEHIKTGEVSNLVTIKNGEAMTLHEKTVYPSDTGDYFSVSAGEMAILTGYFTNVAKPEGRVSVYKVAMSDSKPAHSTGNSCNSCMTDADVPATELHSVNIPSLYLDLDNPVLVVKTPGQYKLVPDSTLSDIIITLQGDYPIQEVNCGLDSCTK